MKICLVKVIWPCSNNVASIQEEVSIDLFPKDGICCETLMYYIRLG